MWGRSCRWGRDGELQAEGIARPVAEMSFVSLKTGKRSVSRCGAQGSRRKAAETKRARQTISFQKGP